MNFPFPFLSLIYSPYQIYGYCVPWLSTSYRLPCCKKKKENACPFIQRPVWPIQFQSDADDIVPISRRLTNWDRAGRSPVVCGVARPTRPTRLSNPAPPFEADDPKGIPDAAAATEILPHRELKTEDVGFKLPFGSFHLMRTSHVTCGCAQTAGSGTRSHGESLHIRPFSSTVSYRTLVQGFMLPWKGSDLYWGWWILWE